ncbi:MAG TPA: VOC family protein [Mycobacteriales bacterium]|nr:VOC family protein [Mycobacteriales bacterium]
MDDDASTLVLGAPMHVTIDCADPDRLAAFWAALTGQRVAHADGPFVFLAGATRDVTAMALQRVADLTPGKNRVHVDFRSADLEGARARVVGLGGTAGPTISDLGARWFVAGDPEGNVFCVVESAGA